MEPAVKTVLTLFFLWFPLILFALSDTADTPPKLERLILRQIGSDHFFQGKNRGASTIEVRIVKDFAYYSFDLYKSVSMSTGLAFDPAHRTHRLRRGGETYLLSVSFDRVINPHTSLENSIIVLTFTPE